MSCARYVVPFLLLSATTAFAQEPVPILRPGELVAVAPTGIAAAVMLPAGQFPAVTTPPPRSRALVPLYGSLIALNVLDVHTTYRGLSSGRAREANPLVKPFVGNKVAFVGIKAGMTVTTIWLTEKARRKHPKRALIGMIVVDAALTAVVANNYRVNRKAGR